MKFYSLILTHSSKISWCDDSFQTKSQVGLWKLFFWHFHKFLIVTKQLLETKTFTKSILPNLCISCQVRNFIPQTSKYPWKCVTDIFSRFWSMPLKKMCYENNTKQNHFQHIINFSYTKHLWKYIHIWK